MLLLLACTEPTVPPPPDLGLGIAVEDAAGGLCVAMQLDRWDAAHRATMVSALHELGAATVRHDLRWDYVQSARDSWDWTLEDAWVEAAAGIEVIAMLGYGNPWASAEPGADAFYPPEDPADFARFAVAAAERYPDIRRWEVWNEPNSGFRFWKVGDPPAIAGDPAGYAGLFVATADALRAARPDDEILVGGTFFHEMGIPGTVSFLTDAAAAEPRFLAVADRVAYHPYTLYPPRVAPEEDEDGEIPLWEMQAQARGVAGGLPLAITETGWPSIGEVSEQDQADWLLREIALAQADGTREVCAYTLEDGTDPDDPEDVFGLLRHGSTERKPAGDAFAALAAAIAGMDCNGRAGGALGLPAGVYAVRWSSATGTATMLWTTAGSQTIEIPASAGACDGDMVGVEVGPSPVIVSEGLCGSE